MKKQEIIKILECLAYGTDPFTGRELLDETTFNNVILIRALCRAIRIIENAQEKESDKKENIPPLKSLTEHEKQIYTKIREWRTEQAQKVNSAAYVILNDKTIIDISKKKPQNISALEDIYGMGEKRISKYGEQIIHIIKSFLINSADTSPTKKLIETETGFILPTKNQELDNISKGRPRRSYVSWSYNEDMVLCDMYKSGIRVSEMAIKLERQEGAVSSRISKLIEGGRIFKREVEENEQPKKLKYGIKKFI